VRWKVGLGLQTRGIGSNTIFSEKAEADVRGSLLVGTGAAKGSPGSISLKSIGPRGEGGGVLLCPEAFDEGGVDRDGGEGGNGIRLGDGVPEIVKVGGI